MDRNGLVAISKSLPSRDWWTSHLAKIIVVFAHFSAAALLISGAYHEIRKFNEHSLHRLSTQWLAPPGVHLKDGDSSFFYDQDRHELQYRGLIDLKDEMRIRGLLDLDFASEPGASISGSALSQARQAYEAAVNRLVGMSDRAQVVQTQLLFLLGILGGGIGAVLRSSGDFVGHACYTQKLDLRRWWPLYTMRPIIGGILGFVIVVLLRARIIGGISASDGVESFWWLGVAVLGGFSTVDVTQRLRLAAKAVFGTHEAQVPSG
jgi:hypothetical protein